MTQLETILIIEPDKKKHENLNTILNSTFKILFSRDGLEGLKMAKFHKPALILCSVEMNKISCFLFVSIIQEFTITADIPVLLITRQYSSLISTLSLKQGIDGLINYEASPKEIIAKIKNRINKRIRLKKLYMNTASEGVNYSIENQINEITIAQVYSLVKSNLADKNLDVAFVCDKLGTSRGVLQSKMKKITGDTIGNYIRNLKLKKAQSLLANSDLLIYEISDLTGFNSRQTFIKAFKRNFLLTPSAYRQQLSNKNN